MRLQEQTHEFKVFHLFCGIGGGALGFEVAQSTYKGIKGTFHTIGGIDCDPLCIENFNRLTAGESGTVMDLFDRQQYIDFFGKEPPEDWKEATPEDIRTAAHGQTPDVIFLSPPCKGFSGLLPEKSSRTPKYQALNKLVVRSMWLVLEAFKDDLPTAILIENVPRITQRGAALLEEVKKLLASCGYEFHEGTHDCGEIGGLGQTRKRYLLIARNPRKLMSFIYQPPKYRLKSIGEVLESVPMPGDIKRAGRMHRIPNLQWKTWVRLALIPAGKDWRALNRDCYANLYQIVPWDKHSATIAGGHRPNNGAVSVADPRLDKVCGHGSKFKITEGGEPSPTITGSRIGSGAVLYGDKKLGYTPRAGAFRVVRWGETAPAVTGSTGAGRSNGISGVADPRLPERKGRFPGSHKVNEWDKPSTTIIGQTDLQCGALSVNDPRLDYTAFNRALKVTEWEQPSGAVTSGSGNVADPRVKDNGRFHGALGIAEWNKPAPAITANMSVKDHKGAVADPRVESTWRRTTVSKVQDWEKPSDAIIANPNIHGSGAALVADPRLTCEARSGAYGVVGWEKPSSAVTGNFDIDNRPASVADPRIQEGEHTQIPQDTQSGVWVIISEDGSWHRPITTFEMAMLQGLPSHFADGSLLELAGNSEKVWREHVGNMVPPPAACGIATSMLETMLPNMIGQEWYWNVREDAKIWVRPTA